MTHTHFLTNSRDVLVLKKIRKKSDLLVVRMWLTTCTEGSNLAPVAVAAALWSWGLPAALAAAAAVVFVVVVLMAPASSLMFASIMLTEDMPRVCWLAVTCTPKYTPTKLEETFKDECREAFQYFETTIWLVATWEAKKTFTMIWEEHNLKPS